MQGKERENHVASEEKGPRAMRGRGESRREGPASLQVTRAEEEEGRRRGGKWNWEGSPVIYVPLGG